MAGTVARRGAARRICSLSRTSPSLPFSPFKAFFPLFTLSAASYTLVGFFDATALLFPPPLASATYCFLSGNTCNMANKSNLRIYETLVPVHLRVMPYVRCSGGYSPLLSSASRYRSPRCLSENQSRTARREAGRKSLSTDIEEHRRDL